MIAGPVAYRYARSIMGLAKEQGLLEQVRGDMRVVAQATADSRELRTLLKSPVVKPDAKAAILAKIFAGKVSDVTARFVAILVRKGREDILPQVAEAFEQLYRSALGIVTAQVTTAVPLGADARRKVQELVNAKYPGRSVDITESTDPTLIGGVVVRVGDEQLDASVSRKLQDLRRSFTDNPYIPEI